MDALVAAASAAIWREGRTLATYNLESGAQGYKPLREFVAKKVRADAGIDCTADEILITSGSNQGLDLVNRTLLKPGDTIIGEEMSYAGAYTRVIERVSTTSARRSTTAASAWMRWQTSWPS